MRFIIDCAAATSARCAHPFMRTAAGPSVGSLLGTSLSRCKMGSRTYQHQHGVLVPQRGLQLVEGAQGVGAICVR